jgi:hypothetical protein
MRRKLSFWSMLCCTASLAAAGAALAIGDGTPDGSPPAEETVCENAGLRGAAYGICVAYCEANDCDTFPDAKACSQLFDNYVKLTGDEAPPCEEVGPPPSPN